MAVDKQKLCDFIDWFWEENWTSPSVRELQQHLGFANPSSAHRWLKILVRDGLLESKQVGQRVYYRVAR